MLFGLKIRSPHKGRVGSIPAPGTLESTNYGIGNPMLFALSAVFAMVGAFSTPTIVASRPQGSCVIRGTVIGSDSLNGVPLAEVTLLVQPLSTDGGDEPPSGTKRTATADEHGAFVFGDLPPALYRVEAAPGPYSSQYLPMTPADGVSVDLRQCPEIGALAVPLPVGAVITGRVTDGQGTPLVRVHVTATAVTTDSAADESPVAVDTDDSGQFRFFGLAPSKYRIDASPTRGNRNDAGPAGYVRTFYFGATDSASAQLVQVERGQQVSGIDIQLVRSGVGAIDGQVTDSTGAKRFGCVVVPMGRGTVAVSDAEGHFHIDNLPFGTYELAVHCMGINGATPEEGQTTLTLADHIAVVTITTVPQN